MKKIMFMILSLSLFLNPLPVLGFSSSARNTVIMDTDSGRIFYSENKDESRLIASITKIMTCVIAIESNKVNDIVTAGEEVLKMYGSNIYIELGEKMSLKDLLLGLMLRSGNDAAVVIANYVAPNEKEFVKLMNQKAQDIGMKSTIFNNSHGLDEETENRSSAYDMALLSKYAMNLPLYREITGTKNHSVKTNKKSYIWVNRNNLLFSYKNLTGGKTGYTPKAGKTLVTTASYNNFNLTAVTLNDGNQYLTHENLYDEVFNNYKNYIIIDMNNFKVDNGYFKDNIYVKNSFVYPLSTDEKNNVKVEIFLEKINNYKNNERIGVAKVYLYNNIIKEESVYVKLNQKMSFWEKILSLFK